ncbi:MAG: DUF134 domain-containing protein [Desulfitobacteriaceae bacterium]|nr:DUF134 domain-containing protein [Desulfitobacteriaceae bacterium]MDI6914907.1 DUF134 domain-containing protein [Desulfitobacteriaceae bacterium]
MARPIKWRKVDFNYENRFFAPCSKGTCRSSEEIQVKVEELEAMRLKDIEELTQEECAERMHVSRQTFQNILDRARQKVTAALIEEKAISVKGGNFTKNICSVTCQSCGSKMLTALEEIKECKHCGSSNITCQSDDCTISCAISEQ